MYIYSGYEERFVSGEGFTYNICNHLMSDYFLNNYVLYTDNYYTSNKRISTTQKLHHWTRRIYLKFQIRMELLLAGLFLIINIVFYKLNFYFKLVL